MPVESVTYISDLVATNPIGATDPKSQGDDHIRNIKAAILATFPSVTGAVTASHTQLSTLNEGTLPACNGSQLTDLDGSEVTTGTVADARLSSNVALINRNPQTFTGRNVFSSAGNTELNISSSVPGTDEKDWGLIQVTASDTIGLYAVNEARSTFNPVWTATRSGATVTALALTATAVTVNGVNVTDYARLSQNAAFTGTALSLSNSASPTLTITDTSTPTSLTALCDNNNAYVGSSTNHPLHLLTNNVARMTVAASGAVSFAGAVTAPTIAQSTSTTLAAGQVHAIDGNATLPNMTAGQWVTVINNGSSARTVTKNGSDTMYWTATGSSVTSVTIPARGRASFVCADGTNVYASGNITGSS